jgi:hypothetical protein
MKLKLLLANYFRCFSIDRPQIVKKKLAQTQIHCQTKHGCLVISD